MALNATASNLIVVWYIIASVLNLGAIVGLAALLQKVQTELSRLAARVDPLLMKADTVLVQANQQLEKAGSTANSILDRTEGIATNVEAKTSQGEYESLPTYLFSLCQRERIG